MQSARAIIELDKEQIEIYRALQLIKREALTVRLSEEERLAWEQLAAQWGFVHKDKPSINQLMKAIAAGELVIRDRVTVENKSLKAQQVAKAKQGLTAIQQLLSQL